jgi:DNA-directed RNA polymerase specialized sigma24 family protein
MNDCYGDALDHSEVIAQRQALLILMAGERGVPQADFDDAVQEGRIALWEVVAKRPDAPPAYLNAAARMRITEFITRGKATGQPSQRGKAVDPLRRLDRDSLDDPDLAFQLEQHEVLELVQNAYLAGEVAVAMDSLSPAQRRYVQLRFWEGADRRRLTDEFGYDPHSLWMSAKPKLQHALAHLV